MNSATWAPETTAGVVAHHPLPLRKTRSTVVLFVEDEDFLREMASGVMESAGHRVLKARNAAGAMDLFRRYRKIVDVLLTDVVLPGKNGQELAKEMRATAPELKVMFISGYAENVITRQRPCATGTFYLPKPFSADSLLEKIDQVLGLR
jgi:CheY-like chemotaxis protein